MSERLTPDGALILSHIILFFFAWVAAFAILFGWEAGFQGLTSWSHLWIALTGLALAFPVGLALTFVFMVGALKFGFPTWSERLKSITATLWLLAVLIATMSAAWWVFSTWFSGLY